MDYTQLRTFTVVAHTGNLTQAAEHLHLSQPAVSAQIKSLEKNLDIQLFNRNAHGMSLTAAGERFLPEAESLLQHHHKLDHFAKSLSERYVHRAGLGLIHPADPAKIARLTQSILQQNPSIHLHIQYGMSDEIKQRVLDKQLHGGFYLGPVKHNALRCLFLENIQYSLICPAGEADNIQNKNISELEKYAWIEMSGVSGSSKHLHQFWAKNKISPKHQIICDYPQTIIDLVASDMGIAMVPTHKAESARNDGKPVAILHNYRQNLPLSFIYPAEFEEDPSLILIKNVVETIWDIYSQSN